MRNSPEDGPATLPKHLIDAIHRAVDVGLNSDQIVSMVRLATAVYRTLDTFEGQDLCSRCRGVVKAAMIRSLTEEE